MKNKILHIGGFVLFVLTGAFVKGQNIAINTTGNAPVASAILDLSNNKTNGNLGFLGPYVSLTGTNDVATVPAPATGLIVYNTNTVAGANAVSPGYYYYNGALWVAFYSSTTAWNLTGNAGTTAGTDFVGTTDTRDLVFKTAGTEDMRILSATGNIGIGTTTVPLGGIGAAKFAINGTNASIAAGPHVQYTTSSDDYPLFQQLNWAHDNISINFDAYYDGNWKSSTAANVANFSIYKTGSTLNFFYALGASAGNGLTWENGITLTGGGLVGIGTGAPTTNILDVNGGSAIWAANDQFFYTDAGATEKGYLGPKRNDDLTLSSVTSGNWLRIGTNSSAISFWDDGNCATNDNPQMILLGGDLGLGTTGPAYQLQLSTNSAAKPGSNTWTIASDERLKKNITDFNDGLNVIMKIHPVRFMYNGLGGIDDKDTCYGILAQEILKVAPYTVSTFKTKLHKEDKETTELYAFNSGALTFVTINAIIEQQHMIDSLKAVIKGQAVIQESEKQAINMRLANDEKEIAELKKMILLSSKEQPSTK